MSKLKLSILIPTYNYRIGINQILKCINNIDSDSKNQIEIIISDDSDQEIIDKKMREKLKKSFVNFKYIHNKVSLGGPENWNKLINLSRGEYCWILHHDEFWNENENLVKYILKFIKNKKPNVLILPIIKQKIINFYSLRIEIIQKHKLFKNIQMKFIKNPKLLLKLNILGSPSAIIFKKINLKFNINLKFLVDVDFYIRKLDNFNSKKIYLFNNCINLISSQNNVNSITNLLKNKNKINRTIKKEITIINSKYNYNFSFKENLFIFFSFLILKSFLLITTKFTISKL